MSVLEHARRRIALHVLGEGIPPSIAETATGRSGFAAAPDMGLRSYVNEARHRSRLGTPADHVFFNSCLRVNATPSPGV